MAAGSTYTPLATQTLSSAAASVTFSSISGAYTDLVLVTTILGQTGSPNDFTSLMQVNGDTGANYSTTRLTGNGSVAASTKNSNQTFARIQTDGYLSTTIPQNSVIHFMNYANTTTYKTFLQRSNQADVVVNAAVSLWRSTAAITSIRFFIETGNMGIGSTFSLYGILAA